MARETKTAAELAEIVKRDLAVAGASVVVTAERTVGWTATIITVPTVAQAVQLKADVIAARLRARYDLKG